jgi:hypothetical protein
MRPGIKEALIALSLATIACGASNATPSLTELTQVPFGTPTLPSGETPTPLPTATAMPILSNAFYPELNLNFTRSIQGTLECSSVPPGGGMWRAALSLGPDIYAMDDVAEITLHPITARGAEGSITFTPGNPFPQPRDFAWRDIHPGSSACRIIPPLAP